MSRLSDLSERAQSTIALLVGRLPAPVLRVLAGTPLRADGQELEADVQLGLAMLRLGGHRGLETMTPAAARAEIRRSARVFAGTPIALARVEAHGVPGQEGPLPARLYVPRSDGRRRPLVVYYHGGGWVVGDLDTHDPVCRFLASEIDAAVLAIAYRLAPEHRFPVAVEDAVAAFNWAVREAETLGCDPARVAVAGDSAGGNLAAVVSQLALRAGTACPAAQLLLYPVTDLSTKHESYRLFSGGFFLTEAEMDWYRHHYLPDAAAARDPRASPLLAPDLRGLPPAIVATAGFDVLRDEGEAYARRMEEAGVRVVLRRSAGQIHGFANTTAVSRSGRAAMRAVTQSLAQVLGWETAGAEARRA